MKTLFKFLALLIVLAFSAAPAVVRAQDDDQGVSFQNFYDQLGDQGTWVQTDDYGYVFQPNVTDPNWAPYSDGHWVYTDEGWTWVSDEPWGWATYHYGRWANIDGTGWVWVPGYRWAPAWVSWRYGGGYAGWAPLPPETFIGAEYGDPGVNIGVGFHFGGDVDVNFNIGPGCYNFVSVGDLGESNYRGRYLDRSRNYVVINRTTNITNININKTVINNGTVNNFGGVAAGGPPINEVNAHSRQHIQTVQLTAASQPGKSNLQGNSLSVYAPKVNPATAHDAKPAQVSQTLAHPTFNRGDSITKPLEVTSTVKPPAPTPAAIQAAHTAQLHVPAKSRVATEKTTAKTTLSKPLTSMQPVAQLHQTSASNPGANSSTSANTQHSTASSAFTGEPAKPAVTPPTEEKPKSETTYQPENTVKPQTEEKPKPETTYQPENTVKPQTEEKPKPETTYHPPQPTETYHPQTQVTHEAPPATHTQSAPANKPSGGGNENKTATEKKPPGQ